MGAYTILRESTRAVTPGAGSGACNAAGNLSGDFDSAVAQATSAGIVELDMTPEEVALGTIPLLAAALYVWYRALRLTLPKP